MSLSILKIELRQEHDVVYARQRARQIATHLGFEAQDRTRIATAVSEIARNAFRYAGEGKVEFCIGRERPQALRIIISDTGPGIPHLDEVLAGRYKSPTGMGMGLIGSRRLMDTFSIDTKPGQGTRVELGKLLPNPSGRKLVDAREVNRMTAELSRVVPEDPLQEVQRQNQELIQALEELRAQREDLEKLNRELEDTNRGVVALYAELDEKADYLHRAYQVKSQFLSSMSHEFRSPLNSITNLGRMLMDRMDGDLTQEQELQVQFILQASASLTELVDDLLDLSKVEAGKIAIRPAEFSIDNLFGALRGMLRPMISANHAVSLIFHDASRMPPMNTDEGKVSQILRNFISNALKFTESGTVVVSAALREDDTIAFSVADTGIGIAPEDHERIFEECSQVDSQQQRRTKGTGLGLPLSRKLTELLGGYVSVHSELGKGSTFTAVIPRVYSGPSEVSYVPEITRELDPERKPVLVVEDNRETLFIYEKFLKNTPYQVVPARSLKEARAALQEVKPLAIVLDILLENENSWGLLSEIKSSNATRDIPVFVVTMVENKPKAFSLGADDFCIKPCDRKWLLDHLNGLMERSGKAVLVIDNDEIIRYLLRTSLGRMGVPALEASGGLEGYQLAREKKPGAILLDLVMPEVDGLATLQRLREDPMTASIPVILHTSRVMNDSDFRKIGDGTSGYIPKNQESPQQFEQLLREKLIELGFDLASGRERA